MIVPPRGPPFLSLKRFPFSIQSKFPPEVLAEAPEFVSVCVADHKNRRPSPEEPFSSGNGNQYI